MEKDSGAWIQTYTGRKFTPLSPQPEDIDIIDIAHALSLMCRFNGHCKDFYSVGQHAIIVSSMLSKDNALWGLLHDATEAYLPDMTRPIKQFFPNFKAVENTLGESVSRKFGLVWPYPDCVKKADMVVLVTELRDVMQNHPPPWNIEDGIEPLKNRIIPIPPKEAEQQFLMRFKQLIQ